MSWIFVDYEIVVALHRREVLQTGEPLLILSSELLESALGRAEKHVEYQASLGEATPGSACTLAAVYLHAIATAHAFENGNKRTAWQTMNVFLEMNGYRMDGIGGELGEALVLNMIRGLTSIDQAGEFLRRFVYPYVYPNDGPL